MPKDISSVRYTRLMKIIALLQSKRSVTRQELEEVGEYPIKDNITGYYQNRTLQNDLDFLRDLGAVITYDKRLKRYTLDHDGSLIVNIQLTKPEIEVLCAGLKMAAHFLPHLNSNAEDVWKKLSNYIPSSIANIGADLALSTVMAVPVAPVKSEVFSSLVEAKYKRSAVSIRYISPNKDARDWVLSPYDFYFRGNAWYMISYNHKHKALSTHRISRIVKVALSDDDYIPPEKGGFSSDYTSTAWHIAPGSERHFVKVQLFGNLANSMREIKWHPTQVNEELADGSLIITAKVPYLDEVARWVLAGAPNAKVIEPEELKNIVRRFALEVINQ